MGNGSELKNPYAHIQQEITIEGIPHPKVPAGGLKMEEKVCGVRCKACGKESYPAHAISVQAVAGMTLSRSRSRAKGRC